MPNQQVFSMVVQVYTINPNLSSDDYLDSLLGCNHSSVSFCEFCGGFQLLPSGTPGLI
jgi:hypothetical protein